MTILDQGYPVQKLTDELNNVVYMCPDVGGVVGSNVFGSPTFIARNAITSAQLLALHTTPVQLTFIAPQLTPPADVVNTAWIIIPKSISLHYLYATAAYTLNAGTLELYYGLVANGYNICADQSAILTNVVNEINPSIAVVLPGTLTEANGLAQNLYLGNAGAANYTLGGGSLVVVVTYQIVTM